ncbi:Tip elongation aberrant protein Tea4 [Wallemia ichthyophaga EXF-994]|uniref:Tip elongation aberrant protein Tea4 n=1 Tax=Wallemia ichthyophaga (strain EXF-994 / CBS 113033) TaxID=1299270 RepID=R9ARG4_WALI9|nr:Tip elongation aberrant protein Tea4 [Wallemia ichthyophaga EXF-994]EOR04802.1 Tip elongation aberrant protein Tea4 [Wallemia ichthyophaga EXF-994]
MDMDEFKPTMLKDDEEIFEGEFEDDDDDDELSSQMSIPDDNIDYSLVYALHTFLATVEGQASVVRGDSLVLLDDSNAYWWLIRVLKTQELGYIPAENIETPDERLARLNKHRNIDITSANHSDLSHHPPPSDAHQALKKLDSRESKESRDPKEPRNVAFTAPTYRQVVLYPEEIAQAEEDAAQIALEEQESYDEDSESGSEVSSQDASLSSQSHSESSHGHLVNEQQYDNDSVSDALAPAAAPLVAPAPAKINSSNPPLESSAKHIYDSSTDTHSSDNLVKYMPEVNKNAEEVVAPETHTNDEVRRANEIEDTNENVMAKEAAIDASSQATPPAQVLHRPLQADIRPLSINSNASSNYSNNSKKILTNGVQRPQLIRSQPSDSSNTHATHQDDPEDDDKNTTYLTTNTSPLLDPATSPTRKVTITPDVAQSPDPHMLMKGVSSPTQQIAQNQNSKASFDELMTMDSQSSETSSQKTSIWRSSPLMSDRGKDKKQAKEEKKKAKKLQKENSSHSLSEMTSNESIKKKKSGVFGNLFRKKERKPSGDSFGDGVDSIKSSDSFTGSDNHTESIRKSSSQDMEGRTSLDSRNISPQLGVRQSPSTFTPLAPINHPSPNLRPRNDSLANSSSLTEIKPSGSNNSLNVSPKASKGLETSPALSQQSWASPNSSLNARPGSLLGVPTLNVMRMFAAPSLKSEATFKTVLVNGSTSATDLIKQAMQRFRLATNVEESDFFLTIKEQESGKETVMEPNQKPLALFNITNQLIVSRQLNAPSNDLPKVKRSSVGSISSINSNLSTLPAISSLGDYSDDSAVKMYIHCRKTSSVDLHETIVDNEAEDVYAGYMNDPSVSSPVFDDLEPTSHINQELNAKNNASLSAKKKRESQLLMYLHLDSNKVNLCVVVSGKDAPEGVVLDKNMKSGGGLYEHRLTIPTNSTVAEVIEQSLNGFGILEGVVDGGDDVESHLDGKKSAVRYRLAVKPRNKKSIDANFSLNPNSRVIDANREIIQIFSGDDFNKDAQRLGYRGYPDQELQFVLIRADKLSHQSEGVNIVKAAVDDITDAPSLAEIIARQRSEKQRSKGVISPVSIDRDDSKSSSDDQATQITSPVASSSSYSQSTPQQTVETPVQSSGLLDDHNFTEQSVTEHGVTEQDATEQDATPSKRSSYSKSEQVEELVEEQEKPRGLGLRDSDSMENYHIGDYSNSSNTTVANSVADRSSQTSSVMTSSTNDRVTSGEGFDDIVERLWQRETKYDDNSTQDGAKQPHKDLMRSQSSFSLQTAHTDLSSSMSTITGQEFTDARSTPLSRRSGSSNSGSEDDEKAIREIQSAPVNVEGEGCTDKRQSGGSRNSRNVDEESVKSFDDSTKESTQEAVSQLQLQTYRQSGSTASSISESGRRSNTPSTTATTNPTPPSVLFQAAHPNINGTASTDESHENSYDNTRNADLDSSASSRSSVSTPNHATHQVHNATKNDRKTRIGNAMQDLNIGHFLTLSQHARRQQPSAPSGQGRESDYINDTWFARSNNDSVYDSVRSDLDGIEGELDRLLQQTLAL